MIIKHFHRTRQDGVNLYKTIDVVVDEYNEPVRDAAKNIIPTGFYIMQNETNTPYPFAIDVENTKYTYSTTNIQIPQAKTLEAEDSAYKDLKV